jgi:hypothetical protein
LVGDAPPHSEVRHFAPDEAAGGARLEGGDDRVDDALHLRGEVLVCGEEPTRVAVGVRHEVDGEGVGGGGGGRGRGEGHGYCDGEQQHQSHCAVDLEAAEHADVSFAEGISDIAQACNKAFKSPSPPPPPPPLPSPVPLLRQEK